MDYRVAIVGAGISGLSAGYQLLKAGLKPVIFEKESFAGGRMSSEFIQGFVIDKGAYTLPEFYSHLRGFAAGLGMETLFTETSGLSSTFVHGKEYQVKIGDPKEFLTCKLLSIKNKAEMVKLFLYALSQEKALDLANPSDRTFDLETESASEYILKHYDPEVLEYIVYPLFSELFLGNPETNSKLALLLAVKNLTKFKIFNLRNGLGSLPERLAQELEVRLNTPVLSIKRVGAQGPYEVRYGGSSPGQADFDAVVLALPLPAAAEVVESLPADLHRSFLGVQYAPAIVAAFALDREYPNTSMINNFLRKEYRFLATVIFDRHKGPDRVPPGKELATVIFREQAARSAFGLPDETVIRSALQEMDTTFPGFSDDVNFAKVYRWDYGALQLPPGAVAKQAKLRHLVQSSFPNLYIASDSLLATSLEVSFLTGSMVAGHIAAQAAGRSSSG